jgi:hypothetical protein
MRRLILLFSFFFLSSAHGARIIGNGADAIDCKDSPPIPYHFPMLYDFWEAIDMSRVTLWEPDGVTYKEKVLNFTKRLAKRFPVLARRIESDFTLFEEKKDPKYGRAWDDIKDSFPREKYSSQKPEEAYHGNLPLGCEVKQIANQRPPVFPRHPWFLLNGELWEPKNEADRPRALDEFSKCGTAVHEITYRWGLGFGLTDSMGVRNLVGLLFSLELEILTDADWIAAFLQSYLKHYEIGGLRFPLFSGNPDNCEFARASGFVRAIGPECNGSPIRQARSIKFDGTTLKGIDYDQVEQVEFYADQAFASIQTRALVFDQGDHSVLVHVQGTMTVMPTSRTGSSAKYEIDGNIDAKKGTFCGHVVSLELLEAGRPRSGQEVCGPLASLLSPKPIAVTP